MHSRAEESPAERTSSERRLELEAVLSSKEFLRAPALARLLRYLCEKTFAGKDYEIKEYSIATEVYGKDPTFGEKRDSLVRVEISRLRKRLRAFYEEEGATRNLRIVIRAGSYKPEFEVCEAVAAPAPDYPIVPPPASPAPPAQNIKLRRAAGVVAAIILTAVPLWIFSWHSTSPTASPPQPAANAALPQYASGAPQPVRILAGSTIARSVDRFGVEWMGDKYFSGGQQDSWEFGGKEMAVPHRPLRRAPDQLQFRSFRFGSFSYRIPVAPGKYEMRLYFSEVILRPNDFGDGVENRRIFDVMLNGSPLLPSFDIAADAGGADTADIRVFRDVSPVEGFVTLDFRSILVGAWLNAIELIPNSTGSALPIRIIARNANAMDRDGNLWGIDRYYSGGRQNSDGETVLGNSEPELLRWQRYGNFSYNFPVPSGRYKIRLLFAETFFGPHNRGKGGAGSRIFNVNAGGMPLLRNFDIFKAAGGENRAVEKVFHGISPNAQGRIDLSFEPVLQYALVQAIEITEEH